MDTTLMIGIAVAVLAILIGTALFYYKSSSSYTSAAPISTKNDRVLIYGPCGSGKTLLFYQLLHGRNQETQSSMQENVELFVPKQESINKKYEFVDLSGHPSQQYRINKYCLNVKFVLFLIDSCDLQNINNASKMLYHLLSLKAFAAIKPRPKVLVLCNKTDQPNASSMITIKSSLMKEVNKLHGSVSSLQSVNDANEDEHGEIVDIVKEGAKVNKTRGIQWEDLKYDIEFASCSVLEKKIAAIAGLLA
eukprot:CAMPEP_0197024026 /NCGR_PEP_ID=MMETSP1384-20130603/4681_1 /TAXON_ID=29189 /ORGANISM="Ammonia sp." /LENGTH=248 /DNA_ID=CAMNT_0042452353 /DNA_START=28 /DNA_END=774 /DNA_ORIENTATION=-